MPESTIERLESSRFPLALAAILGAYLVVSIAYTIRLPLVMDEFQGARAVSDAGRGVPYRDYLPYKTVLGYYLQWPFLSIGADLWTRMVAVKIAMAALTAAVLGAVCLRLRRWLDDAAILLALATLVSHSTFLERSAELRVDMPTALAGILSLTALLAPAAGVAGLLSALAFCVSQKGVYYVVAGGVALLVAGSGARFERWRPSLRFWAGAAAGLGAYLAAWTAVAGPEPVLRATFVRPQRVALEHIYDIHAAFWTQTLERNPGFYAIAAACLVLVLREGWRRGSWRMRLVGCYAVVLTVLAVAHRQPWPYFFVLWLPTLFVVVAVGLHLLNRKLFPRHRRLLAIVVVAVAVVLPLMRIPIVLRRDSTLQRNTVLLARQMLGPSDRYFAAIAMIWDREQPVRELEWLDAPRLRRLQSSSAADLEITLRELRSEAPIVILLNYRLRELPEILRRHLRVNYAHWSDCVFVYAPVVTAKAFELDLSGAYLLRANRAVMIDGRAVSPGEVRGLAAGRHRADAPAPFRLQLIPENAPPPAPDRPCLRLFPNVYGF